MADFDAKKAAADVFKNFQRQAQAAQDAKGILNFGALPAVSLGGMGVNYVSAPSGTQSYNASALVSR